MLAKNAAFTDFCLFFAFLTNQTPEIKLLDLVSERHKFCVKFSFPFISISTPETRHTAVASKGWGFHRRVTYNEALAQARTRSVISD
jgi:hypothetical protein